MQENLKWREICRYIYRLQPPQGNPHRKMGAYFLNTEVQSIPDQAQLFLEVWLWKE